MHDVCSVPRMHTPPIYEISSTVATVPAISFLHLAAMKFEAMQIIVAARGGTGDLERG
jgi:hypothetical protein